MTIRAPYLCEVAAVTLSAAKRDSLPVNDDVVVPESQGAEMPENASLPSGAAPASAWRRSGTGRSASQQPSASTRLHQLRGCWVKSPSRGARSRVPQGDQLTVNAASGARSLRVPIRCVGSPGATRPAHGLRDRGPPSSRAGHNVLGFEWLRQQNGLPPFMRHGRSTRWGRLCLVALAYNVALAALAWFMVGLVMR
jgi:hypothetical protein